MTDSTLPPHDGTGTDDADANIIDAELAAMLADPGTWVQPPAGLGDRIVTAVSSEADLGAPDAQTAASLGSGRRFSRLRPVLIGAAATIVFLFGGIVVLSALSGVDDVDTFSVELISTGLIPDVSGDIDVTSFDSGLQIDLAAFGLPRRDDGAFYEGRVQTVDGDLIPVGTFHDGTDVILWAGVELDRIELFTITLESAAGPDDLEQASSGDVVLRVALTP